MCKLALTLVVFLAFAPASFGQGYPTAGPLSDSDWALILQSSPGTAAQTRATSLPDIAAYVQGKLPPNSGPINVVSFTGNATGTYTVAGITATSRLLACFAAQNDLTTVAFAPEPFQVATNLVNPTKGLKPGNGTITDPNPIDWTKDGIWTLTCLYQ